jgi:peroxiredoxin
VKPDAYFGPFPITSNQHASLTLTDATAAGPGLPAARIGKEAPDFSLPYIGGTTNLRPFWHRGKPLILLFSCGCVPCEEAARALETAPELKKRSEVVIVVTNKYAATPEAVKQFRERSSFRGPILADDGSVAPAFDALHCPRLWLLDAAGVARWSGKTNPSRPLAVVVNELLTALAGLSPPAPTRAGRE